MSYKDKLKPVASYKDKLVPIAAPQKDNGIFSTGTLKGETSYKANTQTSNPLGNIIRTGANIPSSAAKLARGVVAPVNPLDTGNPINIGGNIARGAEAFGDIIKQKGAVKNIVGGTVDTAKKIFKAPGEFIVNEAQKVAADPKKYASDIATKVSKVGIEDPLLIPSLIYGGPKAAGVKEADIISDVSKVITNPVEKAAVKVSEVVEKPVKNARIKAVDDLEEKYTELMSGTTPGKKKIDKLSVKTENLNNAGTTGKTPQRILAESGIIPEREGAKLSTFEQAKQFRETTAPLREANRQALQEVGLSTAPLKLDDLEARAISNAKTSANVDGGRFESMERQIKARFEALKRAYPSGEIPLSKVDDIKAATWENVFGNKSLVEVDKLAKDSDYAIAKSLQKTIEETAEKAGHKEVAQLNREIGDRLEASRFLEELNGKTVKGGRLLKYMTTLVGSSLGTTLPGKLIGAIGGNVIGDLIIANSVSNPIKRMLLKNLATKDPEAYTKTIAWLQKQNLDRETRLLLPEGKAPAPAPIYVTPNGVATPAASEAADIAAVEAGKAKAPVAGPGLKNKLPGFLTPEPYIAPKDLPIIETGKKIPKSILPTAKGAPNAYIPEGAKPYGLGKDIQFGQLKSPKSQQTKPAIKMVANMPIEEMLSHTEKNVSKVILEQIKERVKLLKENKVSEKEIREFIQKATTDPNFKF